MAPSPAQPRLLIGCRDQRTDGLGGVSALTDAAAAGHTHLGQVPGRRPLGCTVAASVFGQVVAAHEAPLAHHADKLLLSRVGAAMARQLVRAGKLLVAAVPVAAEGLLTCRGSGQDVYRTLAGSGPDQPYRICCPPAPPAVTSLGLQHVVVVSELQSSRSSHSVHPTMRSY